MQPVQVYYVKELWDEPNLEYLYREDLRSLIQRKFTRKDSVLVKINFNAYNTKKTENFS